MEIIGKSGGAGDRLTLQKGTLVLSENSFIGNGNRGSFYTMPGTTAVFLNGAGAGCLHPVVTGNRGTYGISGTIMFGTPEHPLTRDLRVEACYYRNTVLDPNAAPSQRTSGASIVLGPEGRMEVHSADPTKARVVFCGRPRDGRISQYAFPREHWDLVKPENRDKFWEHEISPKGLAAVFRGETDFDGVVFDDFDTQSIVVDPAKRALWKHVSFGDGNRGKPEELFVTP